MRRPRPVDVARLGLGLVSLTRPDILLMKDRVDGTGVRRVVRVLGARYVAQSVGGYAVGRRWVPRTDATVDLIHAASMLGLSACLPRYRRLALLSATAATSFAVADLREWSGEIRS